MARVHTYDMRQEKDTIDIIIPLYNEESCIPELLNRLLPLREKMSLVDMSFIFINDGSSDNSLNLLNMNAEKYPFVKVINFSRNFGHQMAASAGMQYADADYNVIIDADLQDPPELIEEMYNKAKEGYDIVYGKRISRKGETFLKRITARLFYKCLSRLCNIEIPQDTGDFRLMTRDVLTVLKGMNERHRFIRGMVPWVGYKSAPLLFHRDQRYAGTTKYPVKKLFSLALDAIFSFSNAPLKLASYVGLFIVFLSVLAGLFLLYLRLFTEMTVPGITAVLLSIIILGGIQIIILGIIGEYIGRIFEESKNRPLYVIKDTRNL